MSASARSLRAVTLPDVVELIDANKALMTHSLRNRLKDQPVTASGGALKRYLVAMLGDRRSEAVHALYLDAGNRLLADKRISEGDACGAGASIRTIVARALELEAVGLILVHNHPGGQREPSSADISLTTRLSDAGRAVGVALLDHIIVAGSDCVSLKARGMLA